MIWSREEPPESQSSGRSLCHLVLDIARHVHERDPRPDSSQRAEDRPQVGAKRGPLFELQRGPEHESVRPRGGGGGQIALVMPVEAARAHLHGIVQPGVRARASIRVRIRARVRVRLG